MLDADSIRRGGVALAVLTVLTCSTACSMNGGGDRASTVGASTSADDEVAPANGDDSSDGETTPPRNEVFIPAFAKGWPSADAHSCADLAAIDGPTALYLVDEVSDTCLGLVPGGQIAVFAGREVSVPGDTGAGREVDDGRFVVRRVLPSMSSAQTVAVDVAETGSHLLIVHRGGAEQRYSLDDLISALGDA